MNESTFYKSALNKAMALCSRKEYCCDDMMSKLVSWDLCKEDGERVIAELIRERFINEDRYASAYARDKFNYNKWGKIKIASNLKMKKIPGPIIKQALDSIDYDLYTRTIRNIIEAHKKKVKSKNQYDLKAKLMRFGLSKGFESSLLYEILGEADTDDIHLNI